MFHALCAELKKDSVRLLRICSFLAWTPIRGQEVGQTRNIIRTGEPNLKKVGMRKIRKAWMKRKQGSDE